MIRETDKTKYISETRSEAINTSLIIDRIKCYRHKFGWSQEDYLLWEAILGTNAHLISAAIIEDGGDE